MALSYQTDEQQKCVFVNLSGDLRLWEVGVSLQALWADPAFRPQFSRLVDATEVTTPLTDPDFVQALAQDCRAEAGAKIALIGVSATVRQMFAVYQDHLQATECRLFRDRQAAAAWLGVSLPVQGQPDVGAEPDQPRSVSATT